MFRYRLHSPDGDDLGEATYAQMIHLDEEIIAGNKRADVPMPPEKTRVYGAGGAREIESAAAQRVSLARLSPPRRLP